MKSDYFFTFRHETDHGEITFEIAEHNMVTWPELVGSFEKFLAGCGFALPPGHLEFMEDPETTIGEQDAD